MVCCGSVSDFGNVLVPVLASVPAPVPLRFRFRIQTIFSIVFQQQFFLYKILTFPCQKQHYFPESWPLNFDLLTFLFHFCWIRIQIRSPNRNANAFCFGKMLRFLRFWFHNTESIRENMKKRWKCYTYIRKKVC
jgi:hypothetical protein